MQFTRSKVTAIVPDFRAFSQVRNGHSWDPGPRSQVGALLFARESKEKDNESRFKFMGTVSGEVAKPPGLPVIGMNPAVPGVFPVGAKVSFDIEWDGALATAEIENSAQQFKGTFHSTKTTIVWSAEQAGFQFQSDNPPDAAANLISVLGREKNGVFFT